MILIEMINRINQRQLICIAFYGLLISCVISPTLAQQVNTKNLPQCPKPDFSKKTDLERTSNWNNCWGKYRVEIDREAVNTVYEGEFRNGRPNGTGTFFFPNVGEYTGTVTDGLPNIQGKFSSKDGDVYVGDYKDGTFHGYGSIVERDGGKYDGEFRNGKKHGRGTYVDPNGDTYIGEYKDGAPNGQGVMTARGTKWAGEFRDGRPSGQGTLITSDGNKYVGELFNGKRHGNGTLTTSDGIKYAGEWKEDQKDGLGTLTYSSGIKYVGHWRGDKKHGEGTMTTPDGGKYVGEWRNDRESGFGKVYWPNKGEYVGEFENGKRQGQGIYTNENGKRFEGFWENDRLIREAKINFPNTTGNVVTKAERKNIDRETQIQSKRHEAKGSETETRLIWPTEGKVIRTFDALRKGIDIAGKSGQPIVSVDEGTVLYASNMRGFGNLIIIDHRNGLVSAYGHNRAILVREGQAVAKGQRIAEMGDTDTESVKLHFEIRQLGKAVDPILFLPPDQNNQIAARNEISSSERRPQKLADEGFGFEKDKQGRQQQRQVRRVNLQVTQTQPSADGSVSLNVQTNADTASLKINGEEQGGRADGSYLINRVARVGQDTQFMITAIDVYGNSDTKMITVARQSGSLSDVTLLTLKPESIKRASPRDAAAIIIGIQDYKRVPKADFANNDAKEFYEYAVRALGIKPEKIKILLDEEADEVNVVKAFENWLPIQVNKDKTDVYVFFSGHGLPAPDGKSLYLLPHGVDKELLSRTAVGQGEIVSALTVAKPRSVTMFIDACYSGQTKAGDVLIANARPVTLKSDANLYPTNFTVITASANDQISSSSPELKHGIFSFFLMKGMEGEADVNQDGKITVGEMQEYLSDKVARQAMTLNRKQNTQLVGDANKVLVSR
jgi:murein DD-endopeptidase MepM/ murein hydrolase activator NlpD